MRFRVKETERALGMLLRLPEGAGRAVRVEAFKQTIDELLVKTDLRQVDKEHRWIANMMFVDLKMANEYVKPLGMVKFDKTVGEILMNTDLAISMQSEELSNMLEEQLLRLAEEGLMDRDQAEVRLGYLAGAVFESLVEAAMLENRKGLHLDRVDVLLNRAHNVYRHPLLLKRSGQDSSCTPDTGMQMVVARVGANQLLEVVRLLDESRQRVAGIAGPVSSIGYHPCIVIVMYY